MKTLILALLLLLPTDCYAWREFTAMEAVSDVLIIADWAQTLEIADNPDRWYERNPLLGYHPSKERVNWTIGAALLANTILHRILPDNHLARYQVAIMVTEGAAVVGNYGLGIRVGF